MSLLQSPALSNTRMRSLDLSSPAESDAVRSRPVTRSMGQGDPTGLGTEVPSSPHRRAKRPRLCSSSSSDTSPRGCFDPLAQHRCWCPWASVCQAGSRDLGETGRTAECGWKEVLRVLLAAERPRTLSDPDFSRVPEKSRKVFGIFRQWQATTSS
ncbi:hypothetical protein FKM82_019454 [Ascaphus truei]